MSDQLLEAKRALLADWEKRRDELDVLIPALRRELGMSDDIPAPRGEGIPQNNPGSVSVNELVAPGDFFGMTQVQAMQAFLQRTNRRPAPLEDLAAAMYRGKAIDSPMEGARLRNLSSLLSKTDLFHSVARNRWGLAEWYPQRVLDRSKKATKPIDSTLQVPQEAS